MMNYLAVLFIVIGSTIGTQIIAQNITTDRSYIKIEVHGLSCPFCAYGLEKNLKSIEGADHVVISVKEGTATLSVPKDKEPTKKRLKKIVKEAGFTAKEITYAEKPFVNG